MQKTSALYRKILAGIHTKETRVSIGDTGFLVDKRGNGITFGGTRILVGASGADAGIRNEHPRVGRNYRRDFRWERADRRQCNKPGVRH